MKIKLDFKKDIFSKTNINPHLDFIENFYSANSEEPTPAEIRKTLNFLNFVSKEFLRNYLPDNMIKNYSISPKILSTLGNFNAKQKRTSIDIRYLSKSIQNNDLASLVGTAIHEACHFVQMFAHSSNSAQKISNSSFVDLELKFDEHNHLFKNVILHAVSPFFKKELDISFNKAQLLLMFSKLPYFYAPFEKEARNIQEQALISFGGVLSQNMNNSKTKISILKNFYSTGSNMTGMTQIMKRNLFESESNFLQKIKNLSFENFVKLLDSVSAYSKTFNEEKPFFNQLNKSEYISKNCYNYFLAFYISNLSKNQEKDFINFLKNSNNNFLLSRIDKLFLHYEEFNKNLKHTLKNNQVQDILNSSFSIENICSLGKLEHVKPFIKDLSRMGNLELINEVFTRLHSSLVDFEEKQMFLNSKEFSKIIERSLVCWEKIIELKVNNQCFDEAKQILFKHRLAKSLAKSCRIYYNRLTFLLRGATFAPRDFKFRRKPYPCSTVK